MARARRVEIVIGGDASGAARAFGTAGASARRFEASVKRTSGITTAAFAAMKVGAVALGAGIAAAAVMGTKELMAEEKAAAAIANTLRSTGNAAGTTTKHLTDMAAALQAQTGLQDDAVMSASNLLLTFTKISNSNPDKMFDKAVQATADLSVQFGKSLPSAAVMVGKALNDPIKGVTALSRAGIQFTKEQRDQIKAMVESGRVLDAQRLIMGELETQVSGAAKTFGQTRAGQVEKLKRSFEEMTETVAASLLPAFDKIAPVLTQALRAVGPVLANVATAVAGLVQTLMNDQGVRAFASAVAGALTKALQLLTSAAQAAAQVIGPLLGIVANVGRAFAGSAAGVAILTGALTAFVAVKAVAYAQQLLQSFMALRAVQTLGPGFVSLGSSLRTMAMGFSGVSAASMGLAPGLTAAGAGISRMAVAGAAARTGLATLGTGMLSLVGGPVGAVAIGVGALATVIGGDLINSFFGGQSAAEAYAQSQRNAAAATDALKNSTTALIGGLAGIAQAESAEVAAKNAATAATQARQQALAQYGSYSAQYRAAVANERRANVDLAAAMSNTDAARQRGESAARTQIQSLINTGNAVRDLAAKSRAMAGTPPVIGASAKAWDNYRISVATADARFMRTNKTVQEQQRNASRLAGELKLLGPEYAAAAQAASRLANAKTPAAYNKALGDLTKALGGTKQEADKASGEVNKKVGMMGATPTKMSQVESEVGVVLDRIIANIDAKVADANEKLRKIGDRSSPVVADTVATNLKNVGGALDSEMTGILALATEGVKRINEKLSTTGSPLESAKATLGSAPMETGLRDSISQARGQGISVGAEYDATASALASEVGQTQRLFDAYNRLKQARTALNQENSKANQQAVKNALADVREQANAAGVTVKVNNLKGAKAALTQQTKQMAGTQAVARMRAQALQEAIRQQEVATQAAQAAFAKYREQVMAATDAKYNDSFRRMGDTIELIPGKFTALNNELQENLRVIEQTRAALTPAEQALKDLENAAASDDLAKKVADAQAKLAEAQRIGDPRAIADAQAELGQAERDTKLAQLRTTAETERAERDRIAAEAVTAEQTRAEARRLELEAQRESERKAAEENLAVLESQLQRVPAILAAAKAPAENELASIVRTFGRFGDRAGDNYIRYLTKSLGDIDNAVARTIATKVQPYLKLGSPAKKGPLSKLDKWFTPFTDTLMSGVDMAGMAKSSAAVAASTLPGGGGAMGGTTVVVNVSGNEFDAREFARKLEPELARIVSANF